MGLVREERIKSYRICFLFGLIFSLWISSALSGWVGPEEMVSATWGNGTGEIGIELGDTIDRFPQNILIGSNGKILVN
jgi:hypothetical protein